MTLILKCKAQSAPNNKLNLIFTISKDLKSEEKLFFLLPGKDKTKFEEDLVEKLYNKTHDIIPSNFNGAGAKAAFKKDFIDWTLARAGSSTLNLEKVNNHYDSIFIPSILDYEKLKKLTDSSLEEMGKAVEKNAKEIADAADEYCKNQFKNIPKEQQDGKIEKCEDLTEEMVARRTDDADIPLDGLEINLPPGAKPKTGQARPVQDYSKQSQSSAAKENNLPQDIKERNRGIDGDRNVEPVPLTMVFDGDAELKSENNSGVICGRDEGYRPKGHTGAGACYVYAGRSPHDIKVEIPDSKRGVGDNTALQTPNDLISDSAYLYLSQKSDSDALLKTAGGTYKKNAGSRAGQSLAALKADDVVIMARESGIRLITGGDKKNSKGGNLISKFGIELIAGNNDKDLQPLVKGDNLKKYLRGLSKSVDELSAVVFGFLTAQIAFNSALANHRHYDPFTILMGTTGGTGPTGFLDGKNLPSPEAMEAGTKCLLEELKHQKAAINQSFNRINNDLMGLEQFGENYINSQRNKTN